MDMNILWIVLIILLSVCVISWITDSHRFIVRHYSVESDKIKQDTRFALIADLHNKEYDKGNSALLDAIDREKPDAVIIAGDLLTGVKNHDFTPAVELIRNLSVRYPIYYGMGNHEHRLKIYPERFESMWDDYTAELKSCGVHIMENERTVFRDSGIEIAGLAVDVKHYKKFGAVGLDEDEIEDSLGEADHEHMIILIAHDPTHFEAYAKWGADLTVSGHYHGGVMRIPGIGGVISPRFRLFPRYSGGEYERNGSKMIVSCGLGMHTVSIRVFNPGELGIIDIHRGKNGYSGQT